MAPDPRLLGDGALIAARELPRGPNAMPEQPLFDYSGDRVKRLTEGDVVTCKVVGIDRVFWLIIGPDAHFIEPQGARFVYPLVGEPVELTEHRPLSADDLLLPPIRIARQASLFSPSGFPFVRSGRRVASSTFFTSHPTQAYSSSYGDTIPDNEPAGPRPAPLSGYFMADMALAALLVAAHLLERGVTFEVPD